MDDAGRFSSGVCMLRTTGEEVNGLGRIDAAIIQQIFLAGRKGGRSLIRQQHQKRDKSAATPRPAGHVHRLGSGRYADVSQVHPIKAIDCLGSRSCWMSINAYHLICPRSTVVGRASTALYHLTFLMSAAFTQSSHTLRPDCVIEAARLRLWYLSGSCAQPQGYPSIFARSCFLTQRG